MCYIAISQVPDNFWFICDVTIVSKLRFHHIISVAFVTVVMVIMHPYFLKRLTIRGHFEIGPVITLVIKLYIRKRFSDIQLYHQYEGFQH